jgi:Fe2+ or Zn2+ uptake regulation protein
VSDGGHLQLDVVAQIFASHGLPFTRQRQAVWEYFSTVGRASTAAEATEALRERGVAQATVYRTVALLTELGLLVRLHIGEGEACYTAMRVGHSHPLVCRLCRRVVDFDGDGDLAFLEKTLREATGFAIYGHHLEVYGVCPDCSRREAGRAPGEDGAGRVPGEGAGG